MPDIVRYAPFFGEPQLALAALRRVIMEWHVLDASLTWEHLRLRTRPGFRQLMREMGVADFGLRSGKWGDFCKHTGDDLECH